MGETTKETAFAILDAFVAAGGNFLDTANNYVRHLRNKFRSRDCFHTSGKVSWGIS